MRKLRLLALLLPAAPALFAQDSAAIQKLTTDIKNGKADTATVWLYNDLFAEWRDYDSTAAMQAINSGIELSHKIKYPKGESQLLLNKGSFLNINGENTEAETVINAALKIRTATGDLAGQGYCLRSLGNINYDKNDYETALRYYLAAAPKFEQSGDLKGLAGNDIWIGNVMNQGLHQYDKAITYFQKSLNLAISIHDSALIGYNYNNLGQVNFNKKDYPAALSFYQKSRILKGLIEDTYGLGAAFGNISTVYFEQQQYQPALLYNDSSLQVREQVNDKNGIATCYLNGANIYLALNRMTDAYQWYQQAIQLGTQIGFREPVIEAYSGLSNYYEKTGDVKAALEYYKKYKSAADSVYNADRTAQMAVLQLKYETEKREGLIREQQFAISKKNYFLAGSIGLLVLGLLLGYSYYRRYKLKKEKQLQQAIISQQDLATRAVLQAEEAERQRIAQELHDGVGQMMSAAKMNLSAIEKELSFNTEHQRIAYDRVISLVDDSCKEVRTVSHQMMPNALLKKGLANAVREFVDKIDNRVIKIDLYSEGLNERIDPQVETVLYRVVQECVNNVIKHSGANHLDISLIREVDEISITIEDNGKGFDPAQVSEGIGLKNIRNRILFLKGDIDFNSSPGRGTLVAIHIPLV